MKFAARAAIVIVAVCYGADTALSQSSVATGDGITVTGTGQVMVKPNKLQIEVRAAAAAELSADARSEISRSGTPRERNLRQVEN